MSLTLLPDGKVVETSSIKPGAYIEESTAGNASTGTTAGNLKPDGSKGEGSDVTIEYNPNKTTGGLNVDGDFKRPAKIGLGHEIIHTLHMFNGERDVTPTGKHDPDFKSEEKPLTKEELKTREQENKIRKEQGVPARLLSL